LNAVVDPIVKEPAMASHEALQSAAGRFGARAMPRPGARGWPGKRPRRAPAFARRSKRWRIPTELEAIFVGGAGALPDAGVALDGQARAGVHVIEVERHQAQRPFEVLRREAQRLAEQRRVVLTVFDRRLDRLLDDGRRRGEQVAAAIDQFRAF
jgi:hypothetical protein